jgi:hypothetical protein
MSDIDELDRIWREGLVSADAAMTPITDPTTRVAERVRRRRRVRMTLRGVGVAVVGIAIVLAMSLSRSPQRDHFATSPPLVRVAVVVGDLNIHFPGRPVSGRPPQVELPNGVIRFDVRTTGASDRLVINGVPGFVALVGPFGHDTVTVTVRLAPGRYLMHSTILGHTEAGEEVILIVK